MNTTLPYIKYIADMEHYNDVLSMALFPINRTHKTTPLVLQLVYSINVFFLKLFIVIFELTII